MDQITIPNSDYYYEKVEGKVNWDHGDLAGAVDFIVAEYGAGRIAKMLEVGCGVADITAHLPEGLAYTGLDSHLAFIQKSREKYPGHEFILGNATEVPFRDESFDLVFSHQVIEMLSQPQRALAEMMRVVRQGGYVVIIAPNLENPWSRIHTVRDYSKIKKVLFMVARFYDLALRFLGISRFRIIPQNHVELTGRFEMSDDDLKYVTSAWEIAHLFKRGGFRELRSKNHRYKMNSIKNVFKALIITLPPLRYYGGGMFFVFQKV